MYDFTLTPIPTRVVFREGALADLPAEAEKLGSRFLIISTLGRRGLADRAAELLGDRAAGLFDQATMHVPMETAEAARGEAKRLEADACLAIGGGSTVGLAKAVALDREIPILAVPTTYSGSETTSTWGLTEGGTKRTGKDAKVLPRTILYDPALTLGLPRDVSAPSGMNAMAHCVEAMYAPGAGPLTSLMAEDGIRALARALPAIADNPEDRNARHDALYGAWLAGMVMEAAGNALHHKLCHILGGAFNLPHAETHTIILPHATAYNAAAVPEVMQRIAAALGADDAATGLFALNRRIGTLTALKDVGMPEDGIDRAVDGAVNAGFWNPAPLEPQVLRRLLTNAYEGRPPEPYLAAKT
jgi:alcohol dehydrogenase class IV